MICVCISHNFYIRNNIYVGWMEWMGWDWMVIIGRRQSKSTFGANDYCMKKLIVNKMEKKLVVLVDS